jgi:hypothetical protein
MMGVEDNGITFRFAVILKKGPLSINQFEVENLKLKGHHAP